MLSGGEEESGSSNSGSYFENSAAAFQLSGVFALIEIDIHKKSTSTNDVEVLCAVKLRKYAQKEKTPKNRGSKNMIGSIEKIAELLASAWVAELSESLSLYLADTFTGNVESFSDLLEGPCLIIIETEAQLEDHSLALCECSEHLIELFL